MTRTAILVCGLLVAPSLAADEVPVRRDLHGDPLPPGSYTARRARVGASPVMRANIASNRPISPARSRSSSTDGSSACASASVSD